MRSMKKVASLALALVLCLSLSVGVWADGSGTSTLTIKTTSGHTYEVYQLLKGDVSGLRNGAGTLSNVSAGQNLKADTAPDAFINAIKDLTNEELGNTAASYLKTTEENKLAEPKYRVTGNGNDVATTVENGYYLVKDTYSGSTTPDDASTTISRYMVAVVGNTTMTPKVSTPAIDKKIIDTDANRVIDDHKQTDTAAIGDVIEYEVTGKVPNTEGYTYYYYVLHDTMSKGLTLNANSFAVKIGTKPLAKDMDYTVYVTNNSDGTTEFQLTILELKTLVNTANNGVSVNSDISIKYTATVNDNAEIGRIPNTNTAKLEYSNNPNLSSKNDKTDKPGLPNNGTATGIGPELTTKTYVTELTILKVDGNGQKLTGAEFTLTGNNLTKVIVWTDVTFVTVAENETGEYYKLKNGTFTKEAPTDNNTNQNEDKTPKYKRVTSVTASTQASTEGSSKKIAGTVNTEGYLVFTGLNVGEYTLTETKTPVGFNTISPISFTISAKQTDATETTGGEITWASNNETIKLDSTNGVFDVTVVNQAGATLPETGGTGTTIFYVVGGMLAVLAAVLLITRKRMGAEN